MRTVRNGMTLTEVVLALAITSIVGASIAGVSIAISTACEHGRDFYESNSTGRAALFRLTKTIRNARLVTDAGSGYLIVWDADHNGDGKINQDELSLIDYNFEEKTITREQVVLPEDATAETRATWAGRVNLDDADSRLGVLTPIEFNAYYAPVVIAENVHEFVVSTSPAPPMTNCVDLKVTVGSGDGAVTLRTAATLRADSRDTVMEADGTYFISP